MSFLVKLSSLRSSRPISRWKRAWGCEWCDGDVYGPLSEDGDSVDSANDNLACPRCGYIHTFDVDYEGDPVARLTTERLRPSALAALRRLLRLRTDATWPDPWTGRVCPECRGTGRRHHGNTPPDGEYCPCGWDEHLPACEATGSNALGEGLGPCSLGAGHDGPHRRGDEQIWSGPAQPAEEGGAQGSTPGLGRAGPRGDAGRVRLPAPGVGQPLPNPEAVDGERERVNVDGATGARELPRVPSGPVPSEPDWSHNGGPPWTFETRPPDYEPPCGHSHGRYRCTSGWCGYGASPSGRHAKLHRYTPGPGSDTYTIPDSVATALKHSEDDLVELIAAAACAELRERTGQPPPGSGLLAAIQHEVDDHLTENEAIDYVRTALQHRNHVSSRLVALDVAMFGRPLTQDGGLAGELAQERRMTRLRLAESLGGPETRLGPASPSGPVPEAVATVGGGSLRVALHGPGADAPIVVTLPAVPRPGDRIVHAGARGTVHRVSWQIGAPTIVSVWLEDE